MCTRNDAAVLHALFNPNVPFGDINEQNEENLQENANQGKPTFVWSKLLLLLLYKFVFVTVLFNTCSCSGHWRDWIDEQNIREKARFKCITQTAHTVQECGRPLIIWWEQGVGMLLPVVQLDLIRLTVVPEKQDKYQWYLMWLVVLQKLQRHRWDL